MTVLVKTNTMAKKPTGVALVPVIRQRTVKRARKMSPICTPEMRTIVPVIILFSVSAIVILAMGFTSTLMLLREYVLTSRLRYRGTCAISSTNDMDYLVLNDSPAKLPWFGVPVVQMKVFSSPSDLINSRIMNQLLEDMAIEDRMETITVRDGQRAFQVIHDFDDNLTSIRSDERCFVMDMIRDLVLEPSRLIEGFHNESRLDVSHAHSTFRAQLPALLTTPRGCGVATPVYRLALEDTLVLRKRSIAVRTTLPPPTSSEPPTSETTEAPQNDFVQFSGNHLQRITISNMDDVVNYEMANSVKHAHPKLTAGLATKE